MNNRKRIGLGCMGMGIWKNPKESENTIRYALDHGITIFNTGEFYNGGESEMIVGKVLRDIPRDKYFLSVKYGVLPQPRGGIYGLDLNIFHLKAHLTYSMHRLGLDYIDLYEPARMDTSVPVEELVGALADLVKEGLIGHIGLSMVDGETLRRACKVHPIHTVEVEYSLTNRAIENGLIDAAKECGVKVLTFGTLAHGLFTDRVLDSKPVGTMGRGFSPEVLANNKQIISKMKDIAEMKGLSISQLAYAWLFSKYEDIECLIGTTNPKHLQEIMDMERVRLLDREVAELEAIVNDKTIMGVNMPHFVFTNGRVSMG